MIASFLGKTGICLIIETVVFLGRQNIRGHRDYGLLGGIAPCSPSPICIRHYHITPYLEKRCHYTFASNFAKCWLIFTVRRNAHIASAVLATAIPSESVCLSVRLSHAGIMSKQQHVAWCSLQPQIAKCV